MSVPTLTYTPYVPATTAAAGAPVMGTGKPTVEPFGARGHDPERGPVARELDPDERTVRVAQPCNDRRACQQAMRVRAVDVDAPDLRAATGRRLDPPHERAVRRDRRGGMTVDQSGCRRAIGGHLHHARRVGPDDERRVVLDRVQGVVGDRLERAAVHGNARQPPILGMDHEQRRRARHQHPRKARSRWSPERCPSPPSTRTAGAPQRPRGSRVRCQTRRRGTSRSPRAKHTPLRRRSPRPGRSPQRHAHQARTA